jgi:gliding motility-associated lipoprotein GldJ
MKNVSNLKLLGTLMVCSALLVGCSRSSSSGNVDSATGWHHQRQDKEVSSTTPITKSRKRPQGQPFIEGGTFTMGKVQDDPMHDWNNAPTQQHVQSFYMDETEVTNQNYLIYLDYLKACLSTRRSKLCTYLQRCTSQTLLVWRNRLRL